MNRPRYVLGLGVGVESIRAVLALRGRVRWSREVALSSGSALEDALAKLLSGMPRRRLLPTVVVGAVGPQHSQLRHLRGLPPLKNRLLDRIVSQDPSRFFLQDDVPIVTTGVQLLGDGTAWAGAIDEKIVDAIVSACRRRRLGPPLVAPTAAVLTHVLDDERIRWRDGSIVLTLVQRDRALVECRRDRTDVEVLDAMQFADALGAVRHFGHPLVHRPRSAAQRSISAWRIALAAACALAALAFSLVAPGIAATHTAVNDRRELARLAATSAPAMRAERELADSIARANALVRFDGARRPLTMILASFTEAIDSSTMLLSFRADEQGGTLVAVTPRSAGLLVMLASIPEIAEPRIEGAVTSVMAGYGPVPAPNGAPTIPKDAMASPARLEQATVRFVWSNRPAPAAVKATR